MDVPRGDVTDIFKARIEALYENELLGVGDRLWVERNGDEAMRRVKEIQERRLAALKAVEGMFR